MKLRTRVLLGFTMIFVVVIVAGVVTLTTQRSQLYDQIDERLLATPLPPESRVRPGVGGTDRVRAEQQLLDDGISDLFVAVFTPDATTRPIVQGQLLTDRPDLQPLFDERPTVVALSTTVGLAGDSTFRVLFLPGEGSMVDTVVAVPVDDVEETLRQLQLTFLAVAGVILLALIVIATWVNRFGLRPITEMTDVAEAISSGERDRRADVVDSTTEAGRLGHAFNVMLDERDASDARLRQFVSNASHELRTPLTSIRGYLDLYRSGGFRQPGELDDVIRRMQIEAERMTMLVEDLLVLAKFDEEQPLDISTVRIDELAADVAALALAGSPDREIRIATSEPIDARVDRLRVHQALAALVDNAVQHTPPGAVILLAVTRPPGRIEISVNDTGPGLTAEECAAVFDRFARSDRSRSRSTGGSGLGLSIAQSIALAHGGHISVDAAPGVGATFTIVLPEKG